MGSVFYVAPGAQRLSSDGFYFLRVFHLFCLLRVPSLRRYDCTRLGSERTVEVGFNKPLVMAIQKLHSVSYRYYY